MKTIFRLRSLGLLATCAGALIALPARADCPDGVRNPTPAETDFAQRAGAALVAGLPEAVRPLERQGTQRSDPLAPPRLSFCVGSPVGSFSPGAGVALVYRFPPAELQARAEQRRQLQRQVEALEKLPPDKEAQVQQLTEQARAAAASAPRRSRKDPAFTPEQQAQVERAEAEANRLAQAARQIQFDHNASVKPQADPLKARADQLQGAQQQFSVSIAMNVERFAQPAAEVEAFAFGAPSPGRSAGLRVRNIAVEVKGPAGPARDAVLGLIDRGYLQGLLDKPLPEVAASRQRIEANIAAATAAPPLAIAPTVPLTAGASAPAVASAPAAPAPGAQAIAAAAAPSSAGARNPCPPPAQGETAEAARTSSQVGAEVGGAALGGGWGRGIGSAVGGALGALGGAAKKPEAAPATGTDCPR